MPQLIAAAMIGNELARYRVTVRPQAAFTYDTASVGALTPLAAVAAAARTSRETLLELNPQVLRGMTPPGGRTLLRVPDGAATGFAGRLAGLDAKERRAFRRAVTRKRETLDALAAREDVPLHALAAFNADLQTVTKGKWKGRLVSGQGVRVPTGAVLAYARPFAEGSEATGELPELPAPPRAAALEPARTTKVAARASADERPAKPKSAADREPATAAVAKERTRDAAPTRGAEPTSLRLPALATVGAVPDRADAEKPGTSRTSKAGTADASGKDAKPKRSAKESASAASHGPAKSGKASKVGKADKAIKAEKATKADRANERSKVEASDDARANATAKQPARAPKSRVEKSTTKRATDAKSTARSKKSVPAAKRRAGRSD